MSKYFCRLYFGLPGSGKTTLLTSMAYNESVRIDKGISKYKYIYGNFPCNVKHYRFIPYDYLGRYQIDNALILIDEGSIEADNRDYKAFGAEKKRFFKLHRHYKTSIVFANQEWDGLDKKIRTITDEVYYCSAAGLTGLWFTRCYKIPYGILFPDPKTGQKYGDIIQGYAKPNLFARLFAKHIFRPKYYKYFDSYDAPKLPPLPADKPSCIMRVAHNSGAAAPHP